MGLKEGELFRVRSLWKQKQRQGEEEAEDEARWPQVCSDAVKPVVNASCPLSGHITTTGLIEIINIVRLWEITTAS